MTELDLKALREYYERRLRIIDLYAKAGAFKEDAIRAASLRFILSQIKRVEECSNCEGTGKVFDFQIVGCALCGYLRADLLKLQREVII